MWGGELCSSNIIFGAGCKPSLEAEVAVFEQNSSDTDICIVLESSPWILTSVLSRKPEGTLFFIYLLALSRTISFYRCTDCWHLGEEKLTTGYRKGRIHSDNKGSGEEYGRFPSSQSQVSSHFLWTTAPLLPSMMTLWRGTRFTLWPLCTHVTGSPYSRAIKWTVNVIKLAFQPTSQYK